MATPSSFYVFMLYADTRFKRLRVWFDHVNLTVCGLVGLTVCWSVTKSTDGLGLGLLAIAAANLVITITHYASSYYHWRKET